MVLLLGPCSVLDKPRVRKDLSGLRVGKSSRKKAVLTPFNDDGSERPYKSYLVPKQVMSTVWDGPAIT
jgi:hypothetical protein